MISLNLYVILITVKVALRFEKQADNVEYMTPNTWLQ